MDIPIIVLAAGQSSRMGKDDKLLQSVDGQPLLRRQVTMAREVTAAAVLVALPPAPHPRYEVLNGLDIETLAVPDADEGMNASLRRSIAELPLDAPAVMLLLGDLPDLMPEDLLRVMQAVDLKSDNLVWRGTTFGGKPGHPVVFRKTLFPLLIALTGDGGAHDVVASAKGHVALIPLEGNRARGDLDTPEEWAKWRAANPERAQ